MRQIRNTIGLVMLYEIEGIARFPREQDFSSYCHLFKPVKETNNKSYGHSGKKIGNAHLRWAFGDAVETAPGLVADFARTSFTLNVTIFFIKLRGLGCQSVSFEKFMSGKI